jgi:diguanylate cyclase
MHATYNIFLGTLSIAVAVLVSFFAFRLAARAAESERTTPRYWLVARAAAMGIGIWSMQFIGILAVSLPIKLRYDVPTTLLSLAVAILTSCLAIDVASRTPRRIGRPWLGGLIMGGGVSAVHYIGMTAIEIVPLIRYRMPLVAASVAVAVAGSCGALWLLLRAYHGRPAAVLGRFGGAALLGLAIGGMHCVAVAASVFGAGSYCQGGVALDSDRFALTIALAAAVVLPLTLLTDTNSDKVESRSRAHARTLDTALCG